MSKTIRIRPVIKKLQKPMRAMKKRKPMNVRHTTMTGNPG
jgi:hypothetical protein